MNAPEGQAALPGLDRHAPDSRWILRGWRPDHARRTLAEDPHPAIGPTRPLRHVAFSRLQHLLLVPSLTASVVAVLALSGAGLAWAVPASLVGLALWFAHLESATTVKVRRRRLDQEAAPLFTAKKRLLHTEITLITSIRALRSGTEVGFCDGTTSDEHPSWILEAVPVDLLGVLLRRDPTMREHIDRDDLVEFLAVIRRSASGRADIDDLARRCHGHAFEWAGDLLRCAEREGLLDRSATPGTVGLTPAGELYFNRYGRIRPGNQRDRGQVTPSTTGELRTLWFQARSAFQGDLSNNADPTARAIAYLEHPTTSDNRFRPCIGRALRRVLEDPTLRGSMTAFPKEGIRESFPELRALYAAPQRDTDDRGGISTERSE